MSSPRHSHYHLHVGRAILTSLAVVAVGILYLPSFSPARKVPSVPSPQAAVLAYATNININDLAAGTNTARAQNGLGALALNSKLNVSAQLKANDMIAKDYWDHVSPDGTQPWYWFGQAGYDYSNAGENLAYGFGTSDAVITAWMNSAGHRANILGSYADMGFGVANGDNYQGHQNTVVVAHYGTPRAAVATPAPTTPAAPTAPTTQTPAAAPTTVPVPATTETPAAPAQTTPNSDTPTASPKETAPQKATTSQPTTQKTAVSTPSQSAATPVWKQLLSGTAPIIVLISSTILAAVCIGYIATHVSLVRHATLLGEQYVLHHPVIDASVAVGAALIMLATTIGHVA